MKLTIREIAQACGGKLILQGEDTDCDADVSSVVIDSRKAEAGGVFLATVGERVDGHRFISQVFSQGAVLAVTEKTPEQTERETGVDCSSWGSYVLVEDSFRALKEIAGFYRKKLDIRIVGITGSVGKTSTKEFIAGVLAEKYNVLKTEGNFNNEVGVPLTLLRIREEHQAAVVEMGISDFGEMHRLSKMVRPDVCVITNIGKCHLENLKTRDGILRAKTEIFDFMAEDGEICLNGEDDKLSTLREIKGHKPHFFGLGGNPEEEVMAVEIQSHGLWGSDAVLRMSGESAGNSVTLPIHVPLPGEHMVLNAAAAACVARLFDLNAEQIAAGIGKLTPVSGRNNLIRLEKYTLIDDCYNANPVSMKAAIDLLAMADTEKVAILGDMFELGEDSAELHREVGAYAAEAGIDRILCVGPMSEHTFQAAANHAEETIHIAHFPTRDILLKCLKQERKEYIPDGCTVLIKASHGMEFNGVLDFLRDCEAE
ncbi:MAG: UDP-N-acetylmuramoyl-tripeptide--D-alanyl-D-alanine ligase [Acetatifactor sp.]